MIEFFDRLVGPIDTDGVRIYRQRTSITQLIVMIVLAVICYQFTAIGDSVYAEAMKNFIMNPTTFMKLEQLPMVNVVEHDHTSLGCEQMVIADCESLSHGYTHQWLCTMACPSLLYDDYFNRRIPLYCLCAGGHWHLYVKPRRTFCFG